MLHTRIKSDAPSKAMRLPCPEAIERVPSHTCSEIGVTHDEAVKCCDRAWKIVHRVYGDNERNAHGFRQPLDFVDQVRRNHSRTLIYKLFVRRLCDKVARAKAEGRS